MPGTCKCYLICKEKKIVFSIAMTNLQDGDELHGSPRNLHE